MTIQQAIDTADRMRPNQYTAGDKTAWLSELDGIVKAEIIDTHEDSGTVPFYGYSGETSGDTELLIPEPYDETYLHYLFSKIDFNNAEYTRYNNDMTMFNTLYSAFGEQYNRKHPALQENSIVV